jgi:hypothetical protein
MGMGGGEGEPPSRSHPTVGYVYGFFILFLLDDGMIPNSALHGTQSLKNKISSHTLSVSTLNPSRARLSMEGTTLASELEFSSLPVYSSGVSAGVRGDLLKRDLNALHSR